GQELTADVVVAHSGAHSVTADCHSLDQRMRVVAQDIAVVASARLALIRIAHHILLARRASRHEAPLHACREACPTSPAQAGRFHFFNDLLARNLLSQNALPGFVAADLAVAGDFPRTLHAKRLEADEILSVLFHRTVGSWQ